MTLVCYHGNNPHVITQDRADLVLIAISEPDRRKILSVIKNDFKSVNEIAKELDFSASTVYRRISELNEKNLLISTSRIRINGKREFFYKSKICKVYMKFVDDSIDIQIYTNLRD